MQDNYELEELRRKARSFVLELRSEAAWANFMAKFNAFETAVLGLKYRPDQPRAPKGTPEGGQWIVDVGSARQRLAGENGEGERIELAGSSLPIRGGPAGGFLVNPNGNQIRLYDGLGNAWCDIDCHYEGGARIPHLHFWYGTARGGAIFLY